MSDKLLPSINTALLGMFSLHANATFRHPANLCHQCPQPTTKGGDLAVHLADRRSPLPCTAD